MLKHLKGLIQLPLLLLAMFMPTLAQASAQTTIDLNQTGHPIALLALGVFILAYVFVILEEFIDLKKSKPVLLGAGMIWICVAWLAKDLQHSHEAHAAVRYFITEYAELFLFLIVAMTYVAAMEDRLIFDKLRAFLVRKQFSYRSLFWITGFCAFFISPFADNLTTALIMCAVIMAVGVNSPTFVSLSCIHIVVGANAGGVFSPFGDLTTLMVWQKGVIPFEGFFKLFVPALVNFVVPGLCMHYFLPKGTPKATNDVVRLKRGAWMTLFLFISTILTAVMFQNFLEMPAMLGMMMGLGYLQIYSFYYKKTNQGTIVHAPLDVFSKFQGLEWDTLLFFYGIILGVGGLATLGYLSHLSHMMFTEWGQSLPAIWAQTPANVMIGLISAVIDNIPVMFAVLTMDPAMSEGQWLLVTLTAGVGGSLLSIGSAAGVALMGQAKGQYTFMSHLKWTWAVALGYVASIAVHMLWNYEVF